VITSGPVQITGIDAATAWSASGGTACVGTNTTNCGCADGSFSASGSITNNQYICARHTSAASNSTSVNTTVTVGGVSDTFTSTTVASGGSDTTPDAFSFTDQTGVALNTTITSGPVQITGIDATTSWTASGGTACVGSNTTNCGCADGSFAASGTLTNNQYICARHTSSSANSTAVNTTVTVGGVSDTFTSTTLSSGADTTPNAFTFTDQTNVALSTVITSLPVQITGIDAQATWTASGGTACVGTNTTDCGCAAGVFATSGTITNNQYICARHTSSASNSTATNTTVTVGGVSDIFTSTTLAASGGGGGPFAVNVTGPTNGIILSGDSKIFCDRNSGPDCTETYASGSSVALTAIPEVGYSFALWGSGLGSCSTNNTNPCTLSVSAATTVAATMTAAADPGTGARVTTTINGLSGDVNRSVSPGFVNVQYTIRSCPELYVIVNAPALGIVYSYINSAGTALALPTLSAATPHRSGLADGTYTLYAASAPAGLYDVYLICDTVSNGSLNLDSTGLSGVYTHLRVTVQ
jgi:hypothetical protein